MLNFDHNQIAKSATNNSTAKAQYSFSKAKRFPVKEDATGKFYDIPPALSKRFTSFGYGNKYDFTSDKEKTPDPGAYKVVKDINSEKAFSFGISRDACKRYVEGVFTADPSIPGPGTYEFSPKFSNEGRKISLGAKLLNVKSSEIMPGPGAYNHSWAISSGKYVISSARNLQVHSFPPKTSLRFPKESINKCPDPCTYNTDKGFVLNSKVLSTCKSSGSISFGLTSRDKNKEVTNTPGPGSYRLPSEFGYYETPKKNTQPTSFTNL